MNVAVFGGSFNPPHVAHVLAVAYVLATEEVDQVVVVPCYLHPFGKALAPFEHRFAMTCAAMEFLPRTEVSRIEQELGGPSRTLRTIRELRRLRPSDSFRLVIGADLLLEGKRWHGFDEVIALAPPITLGRAGVLAFEAPPAVLPDVSSTLIRQAIAEGKAEIVRRMLPRTVFRYILEHDLYTSREGG